MTAVLVATVPKAAALVAVLVRLARVGLIRLVAQASQAVIPVRLSLTVAAAAVERREPAALVAAGTLALMGLPTRAVAAVVSEPSRKTAGQVAAARLSFV